MNIDVDAKRLNDLLNLDSNYSSGASNLRSDNDDEFYKNGYEKAGITVIFTQKEYIDASLEIRVGADKDEENLKRVFGRYGFDTRHYRDFTTEEIVNKLKEGNNC